MNDTVSDPSAAPTTAAAEPPDLDAIEADFDRVERALRELADGTYADPTDTPTDAPTVSSDDGVADHDVDQDDDGHDEQVGPLAADGPVETTS